MIDCPNVAIRDALPEFLHDALDRETAQQIEAHLADCAPCAEELALMRAVIETSPVRAVNVTQIVAAIPPYRRRSRFDSGHMRMAAGFLVAAIGLSAMTVTYRNRDNGSSQQPVVSPSTVTQADVGISLVGVGNLSDAQLAQLTRELDRLDATPVEEPESVTPLAMEGGL